MHGRRLFVMLLAVFTAIMIGALLLPAAVTKTTAGAIAQLA